MFNNKVLIRCFVVLAFLFISVSFSAQKLPMPNLIPGDTVFVGHLDIIINKLDSTIVYFTQNGTAPSPTNGTFYATGYRIGIDSTTDLMVIAFPYNPFDTSLLPSDIRVCHYVRRLSKPYASGLNGMPLMTFFIDSTTVELHVVEPSQIFYTTDNSTPDTTSNLYTEPLKLFHTAIIKAISCKIGRISSDVAKYSIYRTNDSLSVSQIPSKPQISHNCSYSAFVTVSGRKLLTVPRSRIHQKILGIKH